VFETRSNQPERIDTGDYTPDEYKTFLREIAFINRYLGDSSALKKNLLDRIEQIDLREFSVLDVGCGSGELLRQIAEFARASGRAVALTGVDLNTMSSEATRDRSEGFPEVSSIQADALNLPFANAAFDFAISSLFLHHLAESEIVVVLKEMARVSRRGIVVIDLNRDPIAYVSYKVFCFVFRISRLVREDGSLSIRKGFLPSELETLAAAAGLNNFSAKNCSPGRVVLMSGMDQRPANAHHLAPNRARASRPFSRE
jgi:ubiquinone/menaquinone biosynthesis C-methylase UbiE